MIGIQRLILQILGVTIVAPFFLFFGAHSVFGQSSLQSVADTPLVKEYQFDGLVPWYSLNPKNRIRAAYALHSNETRIQMPDIPAKKEVLPFQTPYRTRYNFHGHSDMSGKKRLIRWLSVSKDIPLNRYYYAEQYR